MLLWRAFDQIPVGSDFQWEPPPKPGENTVSLLTFRKTEPMQHLRADICGPLNALRIDRVGWNVTPHADPQHFHDHHRVIVTVPD